MPTLSLTPAQQEAIQACLTADQSVEFSETSPSFFVRSTYVKPRQFEELTDAYEVDHVSQSYNDALRPVVCVCFWLVVN